MSDWVFPHGQGDSDTVYAQTTGEREELAERLEAVSATHVYIGSNPYGALATDTLLNLDDWR